jgi:hypothetical protein
MADSVFQPIGFLTLAHLAEKAATNAQRLLEPANLAILLESARMHRSNSKIQAAVASLFARMFSVPASLELHKAGCITVLVDAIKAQGDAPVEIDVGWDDSEDLQHQACAAFWALLKGHSREIRAQALKDGAADALLLAMSQGQSRETVQMNGFVALCTLLDEHPENLEAVGFKVIRAVVKNMLFLTENAPIMPRSQKSMVKYSAAAVLYEIMKLAWKTFPPSTRRQFQDELGQCGGIKALAICLRAKEIEYPPISCPMWISTLFPAA